MNWKNVLKLVASFGLAIGPYFITPSQEAQAIAAAAAVMIAQRNRGLQDPAEPPAPASRW